jgi:hypothetical protein
MAGLLRRDGAGEGFGQMWCQALGFRYQWESKQPLRARIEEVVEKSPRSSSFGD